MKPSKYERKKSKRLVEKNVRDAITQEKKKKAKDIVLQNRISWSTYNKLRQTEGLMTTPKRVAESTAEGEPKPKRKRHGCRPDFLNFNKDKLLQEARAWMPTKTINWSKLAREYSIESPNGGQIIKEFLLQN